MDEHRRTNTAAEKLFSCCDCGKCFKRKTRLKRHRRGVHGQEELHPCLKCAESFLTVAELRLHQGAFHGQGLPGQPVVCDDCGETVPSLYHLNEHRYHTHPVDPGRPNHLDDHSYYAHPADPGCRPGDPGPRPGDPDPRPGDPDPRPGDPDPRPGDPDPRPDSAEGEKTLVGDENVPTQCRLKSPPAPGEICVDSPPRLQKLVVRSSSPSLQTGSVVRSCSPPPQTDSVVCSSSPPSQTNKPPAPSGTQSHCVKLTDKDTKQNNDEMQLTVLLVEQDHPYFQSTRTRISTGDGGGSRSDTKIHGDNSLRRWRPQLLDRKAHHCTDCNLSFYSMAIFLNHQEKKHGKEYPVFSYPCSLCDESFTSINFMTNHMDIHHIKPLKPAKKVKRAPPQKPFHCADFTLCLQKKSSLLKHQQKDHREEISKRPTRAPQHLCSECGKFVRASSLRDHLLMHAGVKPHVCPLCGRSFVNIKHLEKHHLRIHDSTARQYLCPDCGRKFAASSDLWNHQKTHMAGEKPFRCQICGKGFDKASGVRVHIRIHTGERPYSCQACGRGFSQKGDRDRHARRCIAGLPGERCLEYPMTSDLQGAESSLLAM